MSLKVEQILDNFFFTESGPEIYTTGARLVPMVIKNGDENRYVWVVSEFVDDSYDQNGQHCSPNLYAFSEKKLL